jgi:peptide/nickel transport system substrate-binding protein
MATPAGSATAKGLTIAYYIAPDSLDPQASNFNQTWLSWSLSYECLLRTTAKGDVVPWLATKYSVSPDGLTYTFILRRGVKFHDGHAFTSADVVYTFNRMLATGLPYDKGLLPFTSVQAVGAYGARFTLAKPYAGFVFNMGNPYGVACGVMSPSATASQMVGTGPWQQVSYTPKQELGLKRFAAYWGTKAVLPSLKVLFIPEQSGLLAALKSGQVDLIYPDPGIIQAISGDKKFKVKYVGSARNYRIQFNNEPPLDDVNVRRAVLLAIDANKLAKGVFLGYGFPAGTIPYQYPWAPRVNAYTYGHKQNIAMAKQLLASAGYPNGIKLTFTWPSPSDPAGDRGAEILKSQLAAAGIDLTLRSFDFPTWLSRHLVHNYQFTTILHSWFADPLEYIRPRTGQFGGTTPPTVQALWDKANAATSVKAYYAALAALALEENKFAFNLEGLAGQTVLLAYKADLKDVNIDYTLAWTYLAGVSRK